MADAPPFVPYPLLLTTGLRRYAFGARAIAERLGHAGLPDGVVAETWEMSDHDDEPATVTNGAYRGSPLRALVRAHPDALVRPGWRGPHLPLLVKFLDAHRRLPVHVHPDDALARARYRAPNGKDEAWHVLEAAPGASVLVGLKPGVDRPALAIALRAGAYDDVLERWRFEAEAVVRPGEGGFATLTTLAGPVSVEHANGVAALPRATSCLLPAALGEVRLRAKGAADLIVCFEPARAAQDAR